MQGARPDAVAHGAEVRDGQHPGPAEQEEQRARAHSRAEARAAKDSGCNGWGRHGPEPEVSGK